MAGEPFPGIAPVLSRKQFLRDLLFQGMRALNDLTIGYEGRSAEHDEPGRGFDLSATELSPSLLAIEAEVRGVSLQSGHAEELQREIYKELAQNRPHAGADEPR
jgi:hypothetical protein